MALCGTRTVNEQGRSVAACVVGAPVPGGRPQRRARRRSAPRRRAAAPLDLRTAKFGNASEWSRARVPDYLELDGSRRSHWHSVRAAKRPACGFAVAGGVGAPASCHAA
jgi:hypothetical protein